MPGGGSAWVRITLGRRRRDDAARADADELEAELAAAYWMAYRERMASIGFVAMARQFPALIGHAVRLGSQASRRDTIAAICLNLGSGVFTGYALLETTGVLQALFAAGPTPQRVTAAIGSLALVASAVAARSALQAAEAGHRRGWSRR
jgi:ATP-binding cassette, subfamily B, bacterial